VDDLVIVGDHIFLPAATPSVPLALAAAHGTGHEGVAKTLHRLCTNFHILGARAQVAEFVRTCEACRWNKTK
jgi:hypothetical protein